MSSQRISRFRWSILGRSAIILLGLFAVAAWGSGATSRSQADRSASAERLLQEGLQDYRAHQLAQALAKLKRAYQLAPQNPKVRLALGLMLYEEDPAGVEAQRLMESVAALFPGNLELQLKLLDSYLQLKNTSKLSGLLRRLQDTMAGNTRFAFDVIYTLVRYGQLELAESQLDRVSARLQPRLQGLAEQDLKSPARQTLVHAAGEVYFIRGMIAASRENKSEAMRLFQAADHYDFPAPGSLQMQMLAEALFRLKEYPLSIQAYETYLRHSPLDAAARMNLALGYYANGMFARARENLQKVLEQAPQTPNVHLYLGLALLELKSNEEARRQFEAELKVDPQSYQAMAELAYLDYLAGDNEGCRRWLEKARTLKPDWIETNMVFGLLYNRLGQFDRAIECLERVIKERPNYYKAHYQLSLAYRRLGDETKAKEHADIYDRLITEERSRQLGDRAPF
jgi:tetratricopeptide (TPR) repeat protein